MLSIGVDVGGTFTDIVLFDEEKGTLEALKTASTILNQSIGVINGIKKIKADVSRLKRIVHGMTVATNAILEWKVAKTGLITTQGFRDSIDIGKTNRTVVYDMRYVKPSPLIPRSLRAEVRERIYHDGTILVPLDEEELRTKFKRLLDQGIESLAICFLHSYRNPEHERRAREVVREIAPNFYISLSSDVVPEYREYERFTTTVLNANLMPIMDRYLKSLETDLKGIGYQSDLYVMHSGGGVMTSKVAREKPVLTVLSGPVGGIVGGSYVAEATGFKNIITYDMGGTSTDVSLIENLTPRFSTLSQIASYPIKTPFLDIKTIGAGGGSIAWLEGKNLRVGPISAGAEPGPACYGKGGNEATITDANVVLGRLDPQRPLGEEIALDPDLAYKAVSRVAREFPGYDEVAMASGILKIVVNNMANAIREISVQRGYDPREFVLVAFGGAGPLHAAQLARELGMPKVLVPNIPGNLCALGLLASDTIMNYVRTHMVYTKELNLEELRTILKEMEEDALRTLTEKGISKDEVLCIRSLDMRYIGQAFELNINVPELATQEAIEKTFYDKYEMLYGHAARTERTEIVNIRLAAISQNPRPALSVKRTKVYQGVSLFQTRKVYFDETGFTNCRIYDRDLFTPEMKIEGPAIVEEFVATSVILPGQKASVDRLGNILIDIF
jgi:N-methylhydantoinase A